MRILVSIATAAFIAAAAACSDSADTKPGASSSGDGGVATFDSGTELRVPVTASGKVFVKLASPSVVSISESAASSSLDWDLAFEGLDVFTNGGVSGTGEGAAFGPLDAVVFLESAAPQVPFLTKDTTGGAFRDWYAYEGSSHALYSRFHVYGIEDGDQRWKVQVLSYYGQRDGAATPALYKVRYADVSSSSPETKEIDLDGTAGGADAPESEPSECIDFGSGSTTMLTPAEARDSSSWHLCVRRSSINVNGELGGPRGVSAVDLDAALVANETVSTVKAKTADSESARFEAITSSSFQGKTLRGDRVVSVFTDHWLTAAKTPLAPANAAWLVKDAAGAQYLVGFASFENPTTTSPGTVVMRIKPVQ